MARERKDAETMSPLLLMEADYSVTPGEKAIAWPVIPVLLKIIYL